MEPTLEADDRTALERLEPKTRVVESLLCLGICDGKHLKPAIEAEPLDLVGSNSASHAVFCLEYAYRESMLTKPSSACEPCDSGPDDDRVESTHTRDRTVANLPSTSITHPPC